MLKLIAYQAFLVFLLVLAGCASLAGKQQIIAIDSKPRGALVRSSFNQIAEQRTPFFVTIDRTNELRLDYQTASSRTFRTQDISCSLRYLESGVGALALFPIEPWLIPLSISIDFASGAIHQCPSTVHLGTNDEYTPLESPSSCKRQIVIPPYYLGSKASAQVMSQWQKTAREHPDYLCQGEILPEKILAELNYFNINLNKELDFGKLSPHILHELGFNAQADRLVYFPPRPAENGQQQIEVVTLDLYTTQEVNRERFLSLELDKEAKSLVFTRLFYYGLINFPNTVTYGFQTRGLEVSAAQPYNILDIASRSSPLGFLASFSLTSVNHQRGFSPFSFTWNLFPGLAMNYDNHEYVLLNVLSEEIIHSKVSNYFMFLPLTLQLTTYLPVGALISSYGVGPLLLTQQEAATGKYYFNTKLSQTFGLGYRVFGNGNFYLYCDYQKMFFPEIAASKNVSLVNYRRDQDMVVIGLGYYFGQNSWHQLLNRS